MVFNNFYSGFGEQYLKHTESRYFPGMKELWGGGGGGGGEGGRSGEIISLMEANPCSPIEIGQSKRAKLNERLL